MLLSVEKQIIFENLLHFINFLCPLYNNLMKWWMACTLLEVMQGGRTSLFLATLEKMKKILI
jgi:hypothetical protein